MKLTIGKRILMFFHWLCSVLICAVFTLYIIKPDLVMSYYNRFTGKLTATEVMVIGIAILAIYLVLSVVQVCFVCQRGKKSARGFITVDSSETGRVRISVPAIEQMVRQAVINIDGISEMKIGIQSLDDAIAIDIVAALVGGCHVPTVTMNMQQAIRKFVELNCGVAVRTVSISINGVTSAPSERRKGRKGHAEIPPTPDPAPAVVPNYGTTAPESVSVYGTSKKISEDPEEATPTAVGPEAGAPAYDIPEVRPIQLTLNYSDSDSESPETVDGE